jgi:hypothetical protein
MCSQGWVQALQHARTKTRPSIAESQTEPLRCINADSQWCGHYGIFGNVLASTTTVMQEFDEFGAA